MFRTIRSKFSLVYISLVVLIILLGMISIFTLSNIYQTINGLITTNYNSITRLSKMEEALTEQNLLLMEYIYHPNPEIEEQFFNQSTIFFEVFEEERDTIVLDNELIYIQEIGEEYEAYLEMFQTLLQYDLSSRSQLQGAHSFYYNDMLSQVSLVQSKIALLYNSNEIALFARRDEAAQSATNSIWLTAAVFLIAAVGGYWMATIYTRRFFAPLNEITESIRLIREGNLNRKSHLQYKDEFGMLSEEFNNMVQRLAEFEKSTLGSLISERNKADSLVRSINEPMLLLDDNGNLLLMNKAFATLFQLSEEHSEGIPLLNLINKGDFEEYVATLQNGELSFQQDKTIAVSRGGEDLFFHIAATPIPGPEGNLAGLIMILHDITEMKRLEKARGDYIATISHEFKTPLTSIVMGADLISDEMLGTLNQDQREIVETIKEDSQRLESLVGEILELSRMESSKTLYRFAPCEVSQIIDTSVKQFQSLLDRNQVHLHVDCPDTLPLVQADFSKITWVFNNLLSNAHKYTQPGDDIVIQVKQTESHIEVAVSDTGMGVPAEFVDQIFEKYVQIKGYDIEVRGSGLGLAAAKEIIQAHGGEIWCDPTITIGSRFVFTLQLA